MPVLGENAKLAFRANFYNLFNTLNLSNISGNKSIGSIIVDPNTQQIIKYSPNTRFGQAESALGARVIELQARFNF